MQCDVTLSQHARTEGACNAEQRRFPESDVNQLITVCGKPEPTTTEVIMDRIKTTIKMACVE